MSLAQLSLVQTLPSLQTVALPGWHAPFVHASPVVQALPSLQATLFTSLTQPLTGLQLSLVHRLLSSQFRALPGAQLRAAQASLTVQRLPSEQGSELAACTQPCAVSQLSVVHGLASLQSTTVPARQVPPAHVSPLVHAEPSLQLALLLVTEQPLLTKQLSVVHTLPSSQSLGVCGVQTPFLQVSLMVHGLLSVHGWVLLVNAQPLVGMQPSSVHGLPSAQVVGKPGTQLP